MSLDYSFKNCANKHELIDEQAWPATALVIQTCIITRVGEFKTLADCDLAYARYQLTADHAGGTTLNREHFRRLLGLWTNCFPRLTDKQWFKLWGSDLLEKVNRDEDARVVRAAIEASKP